MPRYDGKAIFDEQFPPKFIEADNEYEVIAPCRFVYVQNDFSVSKLGDVGMMYGITIEADGITGGGADLRLIAGNTLKPYKGSALNLSVRLAGTKRLEMAGVGKRGDWVRANANGQGVVTTNPQQAMAQLVEDAAVGSLSLVMFNGMSGSRYGND